MQLKGMECDPMIKRNSKEPAGTVTHRYFRRTEYANGKRVDKEISVGVMAAGVIVFGVLLMHFLESDDVNVDDGIETIVADGEKAVCMKIGEYESLIRNQGAARDVFVNITAEIIQRGG